VSTNRTGSCNDGNQCTAPDECVDGACTSTVLADGSTCTDFNDCTNESCQGGTCDIDNLPDGTPCDDFETCLVGETCQGGFCQEGDPTVCPPCETCSEPDGCAVEQYPGHDLVGHVEDRLHLKKTSSDLTRWRWISDEPLDAGDFGDPTTSTGYELCVFDALNYDPVTFEPSLLLAASLPAGSDWKQKASGFSYRNAADKVRVRLKAGEAGSAKVVVRAKGPANPVLYLPPLSSDVEVQLRTVPGASPEISFSSYYSNPVTSTEQHYKAQHPEP
jgi:hypothetical protein